MIVLRFHRELLLHPNKIDPFFTHVSKQTKLDLVNECVLKLHFKKKYVYLKAKTAIGGLKCIFQAIGAYSGQKSSQLAEDNLYLHFIKYFWEETRGWTFRVRVMSTSSNHSDLLKCEQMLLWASKNDPNCLNNTTDAYIPIYREETASFGWINKGSVLTFQRWKKQNLPVQAPESCEI